MIGPTGLDSRGHASVRVTPSSGTTACVAMIVSINVHIFFRRLRLGFVALFANFDVVAEMPR